MVKSERDRIHEADAQHIRNCLTDIRSRLYRQGLLRTVTVALFWGLALLAFLFLLNRSMPLPMHISTLSWIVAAVAAIVGVCLSLKGWQDLPSVAQAVDEKMELRERLSTAFGLIQNPDSSPFAQLQIRDAAATAATLDISNAYPSRVPKLLRLFPIPLLLIGISFATPPFYEVPQPLTDSQQQLLNSITQNLEGKQLKDPELQKQLRDTVKGLKTATDLDAAQKHLSDLNREVRKQQAAEATETRQYFRDMSADQRAAALKTLTEGAEIPAERQEALKELFERFAETLPEGAHRSLLNQIGDSNVTSEQLQAIIDALQNAETAANLAALEAELLANRKALALADIETTPTDGGVARSDSAPGEDAGTHEVQGSRETASTLEPPSTSEPTHAENMEAATQVDPLTGDETPALRIDGKRLTLMGSDASGDSERFSGVFTGEMRADAPPYLPFSDVLLNAARAYAEAIGNNRIPIKYRTQIKDYLEAISTENEKKRP